MIGNRLNKLLKILSLLFLSSYCYSANQCSTPLLFHTDTEDQREFQNLYQCSTNPNISTGTAQNFTIVNATITTLNLAGGGYANFQAPVQSTLTTAFTTTNVAFTNTGLAVTITPKSATHRVKVVISGTLNNSNMGASLACVTVLRGSTNIASTFGFEYSFDNSGAATQIRLPFSVTYIDSPATASATTYNLAIRSNNGVSTAGINVEGTTTAVIIAEEVL